jgi:hypothetical protein
MLKAGAGLTKEAVNYRQHEQCSSCMHFYPLNSCDIVDGNISPENTCDKWEVKKKDMGKDAQFYMDEHSKALKNGSV